MVRPLNILGEADQKILRKRAQRLASRDNSETESAAVAETLVLGIGEGKYALNLIHLVRVVQLAGLTPLPGAPGFVAGLAPLEGEVLTVVDVGHILLGHRTKVKIGVVVGHLGERITLGFDTFIGIQAHPGDDLQEVPAGISDAAQRCIKGIAPGGTGLLSLNRLFEELSLTPSHGN